jgi:hypothetical protein
MDMDALYNPIVGANIISDLYALSFFDDPLATTDKTFRSSSGDLLKGPG